MSQHKHRIGIGHDTHRLKPGTHLIIGGVCIEAEQSFVAHSDGDILIHALIDALLGAVSLGDIGELFPDTDAANRNRDSSEMLKLVHAEIHKNGWRIVNVDSIVFLQQPKLGKHKDAIRQNMASLLGIQPEQFGIKAKTGEHVGIIGRQEVASAQCVVLLDGLFSANN